MAIELADEVNAETLFIGGSDTWRVVNAAHVVRAAHDANVLQTNPVGLKLPFTCFQPESERTRKVARFHLITSLLSLVGTEKYCLRIHRYYLLSLFTT